MVAVATGLLLPACNRAPDTAEASGHSTTSTAVVSDSTSPLAAKLVPAYPGASARGEVRAAESDGHITMWETPDPIAKVITFYDDKAKAAGISPTFSGNTEDGAIRAYQDGDHAIMLAISQQGDGKGSAIAITVSRNSDGG